MNRKKLLIIILAAVLMVPTGLGIGWFISARGQTTPSEPLPAGAFPIAKEFLPEFDQAIQDIKDAQDKAQKAQEVLANAARLTLYQNKVDLKNYNNYILDDKKKAVVPRPKN